MENEPAAEVVIAQIALLIALPTAFFLYSVYALLRCKHKNRNMREPIMLLTVLSVYFTFSPNIFLLLQLEEKFLPCFYIFMRIRLLILALLFVASCFAFRSVCPKIKRTGRDGMELALFLAVVIFLIPFLPMHEWTSEHDSLFTDTDFRIAELHLAAGTNLNKGFDDGIGLLWTALLEHTDIELSRKMIFYGADLHESIYPNPWVSMATGHENEEAVDLLLSYGLKVDLHSAARLGDVEIIKERLRENPSLIDTAEYWSGTPLANAVSREHFDAVKCLLDHGAAVDATNGNPYGTTTLHSAVCYGPTNIVKLLLEYGANPNPQIPDIMTPLHAATYDAKPEILEALIAHGAIVDASDQFIGTPLELAISWDNSKAIALLLKHGAVFDSTLFLRMADKGYVEVCDALIKRGVNVSQCNSRGDTALHIAVLKGYKELAKLLLSHGIDVNKSNSAGDTPLHCAVLAKDVKMTVLLLTNGASPGARDKNGETPRDLAFKFGSAKMRKLFTAASME